MGKLLTPIEIADRLHMHPSSVRNLIRSGAIPGFRPGTREIRVDEDDFNKFLDSRRIQGVRPDDVKGSAK